MLHGDATNLFSLKKKGNSNVAWGCNIRTRFDGISEFISRRGRTKLLETLLNEFGSYRRLARQLNVNRTTTYRWINKKRVHPSNEKTGKIIKIAKTKTPDTVRKILLEEISKFIQLVSIEI